MDIQTDTGCTGDTTFIEGLKVSKLIEKLSECLRCYGDVAVVSVCETDHEYSGVASAIYCSDIADYAGGWADEPVIILLPWLRGGE